MWVNASGISTSTPRLWRWSALLHEYMSKALAVAVPYKVGEAVVGDDPFNGRREGLVAAINGSSVGLQTPAGLVFYDYRQLRRQD